ncbi:MAG TPA: T9SS type A sorting domain-containing protein, partial [Niastella sp.]|nr:T9SS type A sorting domain-containing protein [Niastella sp.]
AIPGGNFDNWTAKSYDLLNNWDGSGEGVSRATDKYRGNYAVLLETQEGDGGVFSSGITNGKQTNMGSGGGVPYTGTADTLVFYYKYTAGGTDTANVYINLSKNGSFVGGRSEPIFAAATYTRMEVPFSAGMAPDTLRVEFFSSNWPYEPANKGSKLYIDEVHLKSQPLKTGITAIAKNAVHIYPNPVSSALNIAFASGGEYTARLCITDALGRQVAATLVNVAKGENALSADMQSLTTGVYHFSLIAENTIIATGNFIKQ